MARNVLITGSSRGIGAAAALAFAKEGCNVGINHHSCTNSDAAHEVAHACRKEGVKAEVYVADVSQHDQCQTMLANFIRDFGQIDVLVNNAGGALQIPGGSKGEFKDMSMDYWDAQINLNLNSAAYCSRYAVADMIEKGTKGKIINISSVHSQITWVFRRMLPYSAGKGGLNMFTKALGVEPEVEGDYTSAPVKTGDVLLLCSDGLSNLVDAGEMESLLLASSDDDAVCRELLRMALDRGAPDNVTLALVRR